MAMFGHGGRLKRMMALGLALAGTAAVAADAASAAAAADAPAWQVIGRQGLVQIVIVPPEQAADKAAYEATVARICPPETTCFVNFYTNRSGAPAELPLPDAIAAEATARFRRSMKNGVELFEWSCRLRLAVESCF